MALSRLASIPLELQFLMSKNLDPFDLLALSHVSKYWRAFVLCDKRWAHWFSLIVSASGERLEECLARFNILDAFATRSLVYVCLGDSCAVCEEYAPRLFLPHMKRVCDTCLQRDQYAVIPLAGALAKYDLRERDLHGLLVLEWLDPTRKSKRPVKVVSEALAKQIAVRRHGSTELFAAHLARQKNAAKTAYSQSSDAWRTRTALEEKGNIAAAAQIVLPTGRKPPKAFPTYPPILAQATMRPVERGAVCFEPLGLLVLGDEVVVEPCDSESE